MSPVSVSGNTNECMFAVEICRPIWNVYSIPEITIILDILEAIVLHLVSRVKKKIFVGERPHFASKTKATVISRCFTYDTAVKCTIRSNGYRNFTSSFSKSAQASPVYPSKMTLEVAIEG